MAIDHLPFVRAWFEKTESSLQEKHFYAGYPLNAFWKQHNVPAMLDILAGAQDDLDALRKIQETFFFIVSLGGMAAEKTVDWHLHAIAQRGDGLIRMLDTVGEAALVPDQFLMERDGRRISIDTFRVANIAFNIFRYFNLDRETRTVFFELGAGLGHLARFIKTWSPNSKYIICDLPISLCFSYMFLRRNLHGQRIALLDPFEEISETRMKECDILLVPPSVLKSVLHVSVDVFLNTCSLGEMHNGVSKQWFDYVQERLKPQYMYSLNRFLNHIDNSADYDWRKDENAHFSYFSATWKILHFGLDNERFFGPYLSSIHPRYLELALKRSSAAAGAEDGLASLALAEHLLAHDWIALYDTNHWAVNYHGAPLGDCVRMGGELFNYWDCARRFPGLLCYSMLLAYLDHLNHGNVMPFEETLFLETALFALADNTEQCIQHRQVRDYIAARRERRANGALSVKQRHSPLQLAYVVNGLLALERDAATSRAA